MDRQGAAPARHVATAPRRTLWAPAYASGSLATQRSLTAGHNVGVLSTRRTSSISGVIAVLCGLCVLATTSAASSQSRSERLYFQRGDQLRSVATAKDGKSRVTARVPNEMVASQVHGRFIYYLTFGHRAAYRGTVWRVPVDGGRPRKLVRRVPGPQGIAVLNHHVFWLDDRAIGRSRLNGDRTRRHFVVPPTEIGGGVGDGLATDGTYVYFSRCARRPAIGRVFANGKHLTPRFIHLRSKSCPQAMAADRDHVYWGELLYNKGGGTIGRANVDGTKADPAWLPTPTRYHSGPFQLAVGAGHIYWLWGGEARTTPWIGRATIAGHHRKNQFVHGNGGISVG